MELKTTIYWTGDSVVFEDAKNLPVNFKGEKIGKIKGTEYNKENNSFDLILEIDKDKIEKIREHLKFSVSTELKRS